MAASHTPLYSWHRDHGATFGRFGGFDMPLWYQSAKNEHLSVLTAAGLFDTSHMSAFRVSGRDALPLLQRTFTNNLDACMGLSKKPLVPGRCVYGAFLDENGHVLDDAICFMLAAEVYFVVVNAGMGQEMVAHLEACREGMDAAVDLLDGTFGKMDVQGPMAARVLSALLDQPDRVFDKMLYFAFKGCYPGLTVEAEDVTLKDGTPILLSRTGYTGEFGFEIFTAVEAVQSVWERLFAVGKPLGLSVCGLAARDSLRAGAVLPLSHQDIGSWPFIRNPWPFALPWDASGSAFSKSFVGDRALLAAKTAPFTYPFLGGDLRKVSFPAEVHDPSGAPIGTVLTCVTDMGIGLDSGRVYSIASPDKPEGFVPRGLCCGFVRVEHPLETGDRVVLRDARRSITVTIVADIRPDRTARRSIKEMY